MGLNASGADSYILCGLAGTTYALRSDEIEQLAMVGHLTPVPNAPPFVDGVTSVRGRVIPAVSLRARFGFERVPHDERSRLIVVRSGARAVGLIVDSAREFAAIPADKIQPPPDGLADLSSRYLRGMAHIDEREERDQRGERDERGERGEHRERRERLVLILDVAELLRVTDAPAAISHEVLPAIAQ